MLGYEDSVVDALPRATVDSFAGTGNPFLMGRLVEGEVVLDIGCGAGFDTLLAARQVGSGGKVIAVDMTQAMLDKTFAGVAELGLQNVDARLGYAEQPPVDVVISNGVINLCPDKMAVMAEVYRVLRPGGRFQQSYGGQLGMCTFTSYRFSLLAGPQTRSAIVRAVITRPSLIMR